MFSFLQVGLAVDDIKGVQEKAVLKRLAMQVDLFMYTLFLYAQGRFLLRGKRLFLWAVQVNFPDYVTEFPDYVTEIQLTSN